VAGGDAVGADLAGGVRSWSNLRWLLQRVQGMGVRPARYSSTKGGRPRLEALLLVDDVVGDVEVLGDAAGVVDVVDGAAAALDGFGHAFVPARRRWFQSWRVRPTRVWPWRAAGRRRRRSRLLRTWLRRWFRKPCVKTQMFGRSFFVMLDLMMVRLTC
jgi:hypothetical protein